MARIVIGRRSELGMTISRIERGQHVTSFAILERLAAALESPLLYH